jgi:hypothetical protein
MSATSRHPKVDLDSVAKDDSVCRSCRGASLSLYRKLYDRQFGFCKGARESAGRGCGVHGQAAWDRTGAAGGPRNVCQQARPTRRRVDLPAGGSRMWSSPPLFLGVSEFFD